MKDIQGKPQALKQVNLSAIRKTIRDSGTATRTEISAATGISVTTVRTLLTEMEADGEIIGVGQDASSGGRKATRYRLDKDRYHGAAFCLIDGELRWLTTNICGDICDTGPLAAGGDIVQSIMAFLDELAAKQDIRAIGIGVPGVPSGLEYWRKNAVGEPEYHDIGGAIREKYGVPVVLENDVNAIALGFGRCHQNSYPQEDWARANMAYVYFEEGCVSAGFLCDGRILRGWNRSAGELEQFPTAGGVPLGEALDAAKDDKAYARHVARLATGLCCVLNPRYLALGGPAFRKSALPLVVEGFSQTLPREMEAEVLYGGDMWHDYMEGMAYLTAERIFTDVRLERNTL